MPRFKRTRSNVDETDSESSGSPTIGKRSIKRDRALGNSPATYRNLSNSPRKLAVYIVEVKLGANRTVAELSKLVRESVDYTLAANAEEADVVITGIGMRQRLERSVPTELIDQKPVVRPEWLERSIAEGKRQPYNRYQALYVRQGVTADGVGSSGDQLGDVPADGEEVTTSAQADLSPDAKFACQRESPLICPNQELIEQIEVIRHSRELDERWQNATAYGRAIASIKAYPRKFRSAREAAKLKWIGAKIGYKIWEYFEYGRIKETDTILGDEKYQVMREFTSVYGIGPVTAYTLYRNGCRTLDDVKRFFEDPKNAIQQDLSHEDSENEYEDRNERVPERWIEVSLALKDELSVKIPRREVERVAWVVMKELEAIQPGCSHTIAGGYRRGKPESNDIDIVITHPKADRKRIIELCQEFTDALSKKGLVTHVMTLTGQNTPTSSHSLTKALTVFSLPGSNRSLRLDLVFVVPEVYWAAVVGWTGSTLFQRDLRFYAKDKGLKFDSSGLTRRHNQEMIIARSEKEVFEILGLPYIHPTMRNADV